MTEHFFGIDITLARIVLVLGIVVLVMLGRIARAVEQVRDKLPDPGRIEEIATSLENLENIDRNLAEVSEAGVDIRRLRLHIVGETDGERARANAEWDREHLETPEPPK